MTRTCFVMAAVTVFLLPPPGAAADSAALRDAAAALQKGDLAGAESTLRNELKLHPADPDALSMLGMVLDGRKQFSEADPLYRKAIANAPRSAPVLGRFANHLLAAGDEKGAHDAFERVLAADPADAYANLELARMALKKEDAGHAKEALRYLDHLPAGVSDSPQAAVPRLIALDRIGDKGAAETLFNRISSATQNDSRLSSSIGWTLTRAGQFPQAETFLTHALAADPSDFQLLYDLGVVSLYAQHYDRAREVLEKAVHQQPHNADALYSLAFVYSSLKQPEAALRLLAEAAKAAPQRADVQRLIAVTTGELGANDDSAAAWDRYAALAPKDDTARRERGFARIHMRQFDAGIADLEWYIGRHPEDPAGYYELGLAQSMNDPTKGLSSLDKALQLKPDFVEARSARGALYYLQGKTEAAVPDLEAAAASQPENGLILDRLGQAYRALDRLEDAIRTLRRAAEFAPGEPTIVLHLANALAEAGKDSESETLMGRYRQMRPTQAPRDLMRYLSLTPEQQKADYRARVEKAIKENSGDANAQLRYLELSLEEGKSDDALNAAKKIASIKASPAILAEAGRAMLETGMSSISLELLEKAAAANPSAGLELPLAIAAFRAHGPADGLSHLDRVPTSERGPDYDLAYGQMLDAAGRSADALAALGRGVTAAPDRLDLYWQEVVLLRKAQRTEDAIHLLDRAEKALPGEPSIPVLRAALLEFAGNNEDARKVLEGARRRWPEAPSVWAAEGLILEAHGKQAEGSRELETAVALGARSPEVRRTSSSVADPMSVFFTRLPRDW